MADVSRRSRGQLFVITGLTLAVILVAAAVLLNTAIYTQNLATRGAGADGSEAIEFREFVVDGVGEVVEQENRAEHDTEASVDSAVRDGIFEIDNRTRLRFAGHGTSTVVDDESSEFTSGVFVSQSASGPFTYDDDGDGSDELSDWTLVQDADSVRNVVFTLDTDQLQTTSDPQNEAFRVLVTDGTDEQHIYVYRDGGDVVVETATALDAACRVAADGTVTLDVTAGRLGDADCGSLWPTEFGTYDVSYQRGDAAVGTYELTAAGDESNVVFYPSDDDDVAVDPAVYDATVPIRYRSPTVTFETEVRIAPGEADA